MTDTLLDQHRFNTEAGPFHEADSSGAHSLVDPAVRLIAFYLPQFHAIAENDEWWGEGFTEWTNVTKALPRFSGHYQPRLPGALGFYDLRDVDVLRAQAAMARAHGVHGFCFHHYWFGGRRILEKPLENLLANRDIDLPFCINWANENWTRTWDGLEKDVLLGQRHSPEDDLAFARSLEPLFDDPRYIRISGRPLLMLYRPGLLPDAAATVARWRDHFAKAGTADPFIVLAQAFGAHDPRPFGMDAAVGFPPHNAGERVAGSVPRTLFDPGYRGVVQSYDGLAAETLRNRGEGFRLFPGVCPQWDNEARRPGRGNSFVGSTPPKYGAWLEAACRQAMEAEVPDERLVFINAWNEWAEGAHLEPDRHHGYAYLGETARVLSRLSEPERPRTARGNQPGDAEDAYAAPRMRLGPAGRRAARQGARAAQRTADFLRSL